MARKKIFKNKKLVNFWIEEEILEKFKEYVEKKEGLSVSGIIRHYIVRKVREYEKRKN